MHLNGLERMTPFHQSLYDRTHRDDISSPTHDARRRDCAIDILSCGTYVDRMQE